MATQEYAASIQGVAIRVTRLGVDGTPLNGPGDSYTTSAFMRVSFTPEYEEGDEITEKSASGAVCVTYKSPDTLKRITMELAICEPDPELTNLISGGLLLRKNINTFEDPVNRSIGWASPAVGDDPSGNGVAIETWSLAIKDGKRASVLPYFHWVFPYAKLRQSGDRVIENGLLANTFEGFGLGNIEFDTGIDGRWEFPVAAERPYSYARTSWAPSGLTGFFTWHETIQAALATAAIAGNVATITTGDDHGFEVGDTVTISGANATHNGTHTITAVPSATSFRYSVQAADAASASITGTATVAAGPRTVDDLPSVGDATTYNVPGSAGYNADEPLDNTVDSIDNPGA